MTSAYGDRLQAQEAPVGPSGSSEAQDAFALDEGKPAADEPQPGLYYRLQPDARGGIVLTEVLRQRGSDGRRVVLTRYVSGPRRGAYSGEFDQSVRIQSDQSFR